MRVLFTQNWDVMPGKFDEYSTFVTNEYIPALEQLGVRLVGGYYVVVGEGPRIIAVAAGNKPGILQAALASREYRTVSNKLLRLVWEYSSKLYVPTGRIQEGPYRIQVGVWKFNQYYNVVPGMEDEHYRFVKDDCLPVMESLGVPITGGWRLLIGTGPRMLAEATASNVTAIAKALDSPEFIRLVKTLKTRYATDYSSRILSPTGRIEVPYLIEEMMKGL